jgi:hypothetical protein
MCGKQSRRGRFPRACAAPGVGAQQQGGQAHTMLAAAGGHAIAAGVGVWTGLASRRRGTS